MLNRDDIIKMARESGFGFFTEKPKSQTHMQCGIDDLERFADLVAAYEREECAKVCDEPEKPNLFGAAFAAIIKGRGKE